MRPTFNHRFQSDFQKGPGVLSFMLVTFSSMHTGRTQATSLLCADDCADAHPSASHQVPRRPRHMRTILGQHYCPAHPRATQMHAASAAEGSPPWSSPDKIRRSQPQHRSPPTAPRLGPSVPMATAAAQAARARAASARDPPPQPMRPSPRCLCTAPLVVPASPTACVHTAR